MITGIHAMRYSPKAEALRAFLRDVLGLGSVDAGGGWLIFKAPPAEMAVHPSEGAEGSWDLGLMCDDLGATLEELTAKGVECGAIADRGWGLVSSLKLPDGSDLMIYEPRYPTAI